VRSPRIVIVGLGPGDPDLRTIGTQRLLDAADRIVLRTRIHPGASDLAQDPRASSCDDLYEGAEGFDPLYSAIADRVIEDAREGGLTVFAVPGHPRYGERTVPLIETKARQAGIPTEVLDAVSFVDAAINAVSVDPLAGDLQIADAERLASTVDAEPYAAGLLGIDPSRPLLVAQVYNAELAAAVKIALSRLYPDEHEIIVLRGVGTGSQERRQSIPLHQLDRRTVDHLTSLWVPALTSLQAVRSPETLARVVARLRAPGGCPWDREQTHESLRDAVLAEAYEAVDAIDTGDHEELAEELGDVLLLVMMHAQLAEEEGAFRIEDVYQGITEKLIRRHPHVFGAVSAETPEAVIATWEGVKATERAAAGKAKREKSAFERLPRSMPATRKTVELLAPRAVLSASAETAAGDELLGAVTNLIEKGLDPERALETSLRRHIEKASHAVAMPPAASGSEVGKGRT
jgi:tetrapyrrole methylase family protein/MazG family protein